MADGESGDGAFEDSRRGGRIAVHHGMLLHVFRRNTPQIQETHPSVGCPSRIRSSRHVHTEGTVRVLARHWETPLLRPKILAQQTRKRAFQFERPLFDATGTHRRHRKGCKGTGLIYGRISWQTFLYFLDGLRDSSSNYQGNLKPVLFPPNPPTNLPLFPESSPRLLQEPKES